jgi:hypothetical protein
MTRCKDQDVDLSGIEDSLKGVIHAQLLIGKELLKLVSGVVGVAAGGAKGLGLPSLPRCCDIPDPCWMPQSLGEVKCTLAPGGTGEICLVITNEDFVAHPYAVVAAGADAGLVTATPANLKLGPKERGCVVVKLKMPNERPKRDDCCCDEVEVVIWVRGCRNHYLRWVVEWSDCSQPCCDTIYVNDTPDYVLHWYDHFYLPRQCFGPATQHQ